MTLKQWLRILIMRPDLYFPVALQCLRVLKIRSKGLAKRDYGNDPEAVIFNERAGWIFDGEDGATLHRRFLALPFETGRGRALDQFAPYSCATRLIRLVYFLRMHEADERAALAAEFSARASEDAQALISSLEYKRATTLFTNHLLRNYAALVLYQTHFDDDDIRPAIAKVERWLQARWDVLFRGNLALYEASSSYEILTLTTLCDIACCGYDSPLVQRIRSMFAPEARTIAGRYLIDGQVVMPHIGDITPDHTVPTLEMFVQTFALRHNTPYRSIWHEELRALGL